MVKEPPASNSEEIPSINSHTTQWGELPHEDRSAQQGRGSFGKMLPKQLTPSSHLTQSATVKGKPGRLILPGEEPGRQHRAV